LVYNNTCKGIFLSRPNRFIAEVEINGSIERCHVKNTGRCKELLAPGASVYLNKSNNPSRATKYDLTAVLKGRRLINIDSQAPNHAFREYIKSGQYIDNVTYIKPEAKYGSSRFDFYIEAHNRKIYIEVKGVTLEKYGIALFPDAPTRRGVKHLNELAQCIKNGYEAHTVFVIQMEDIRLFTPASEIHPEFAMALQKAHAAGVKISAYDCMVTPKSLFIGNPVCIQMQ